MAELDYAFIAEFAKVEGGKLTAVGASYTEVRIPAFPAPHMLSVAGRVRASADTPSISLSLTVQTPPPGVAIEFSGDYFPNEHTIYYDNKYGLMFAVSTMVILTGPGLVEAMVSVDGNHARRLAFEVTAQS